MSLADLLYSGSQEVDMDCTPPLPGAYKVGGAYEDGQGCWSGLGIDDQGRLLGHWRCGDIWAQQPQYHRGEFEARLDAIEHPDHPWVGDLRAELEMLPADAPAPAPVVRPEVGTDSLTPKEAASILVTGWVWIWALNQIMASL